MLVRIVTLIALCTVAIPALAQLPSTNHFSPINYFGRYHGFGYSDGYHACKDGRCETNAWWNPLQGMSTFYGEPSQPTKSAQHHFALFRRTENAPLFAPRDSLIYGSVVPHQSSVMLTPEPMPMAPATPSPAPRSPSLKPVSPENVPAVPAPYSPSDLQLPAPKTREEVPPAPPLPSVDQSSRNPSGIRSLMRPSTYRLPR